MGRAGVLYLFCNNLKSIWPVLRVVHGPDVAMLGQSVIASRYVDWMLHCWCVEVEISVGNLVM